MAKREPIRFTAAMRNEALQRRGQGWKIAAIARRFEERGWFDGFDVLDARRRWFAIRRFLVREGVLYPHGTVHPYAGRFKLTPQMIAEANRWIDQDRPLHELPRRFGRRGWLRAHEAQYCWRALERMDRETISELADSEETVRRLVGKPARQGRRMSAAERRAIELYAVDEASRYYTERGFHVENVGDRESYDLVCVKGPQTLRVEVKGTTGNGSAVLLTGNEVEHARKAGVALALYVHTNVRLVKRGKAVKGTGGQGWEYRPWRINEHGTLHALAYNYFLD